MPTTVKQPDVTITLSGANTLVDNTPQRVLCIGQKLPAGSATAGDLITNIQNDNSWDTLFGEASMLAGMVRNVRRYNADTRIDAIALDDNGGGADASGTFTIAGPATENGELSFIVGSAVDHIYKIAVTNGDTATQIGDKLVTAITADTKVPATALNAAGVVTITANNAGNVGNSIALATDQSVAGVSVALAAMAGGAGDPVLTGVFDPIADERYQTIVWPYAAEIDTIKNFLDARFNVDNAILDGVGVIGIDDTFANLLSTGNTHNSQSILLLGDDAVSRAALEGGAITEIPYVKAAQFSGIRALRRTQDANIGRFVISRDAALDRFGGIALSSLPYFNTPVPDLPLIATEDGFPSDEVEDLKDAGVSVLGNNITDTEVIMDEMVTTYKTDAASNPDVTFKFLNYVDTASAIREFYFNNLKARFAQSRLTEGGLIPGRAIANPPLIEAFCTQLYQELANEVLVQEGENALQFYKQNLIVNVDLAEGKVTIQMKTPIVTQLRVIIANIEIAFSAEG